MKGKGRTGKFAMAESTSVDGTGGVAECLPGVETLLMSGGVERVSDGRESSVKSIIAGDESVTMISSPKSDNFLFLTQIIFFLR